MWLGFDEEDLSVGKWQQIQCEDILDYCNYYRHQGHSILVCTIKRREDEIKQMKKQKVIDIQKEDGRNKEKNVLKIGWNKHNKITLILPRKWDQCNQLKMLLNGKHK